MGSLPSNQILQEKQKVKIKKYIHFLNIKFLNLILKETTFSYNTDVDQEVINIKNILENDIEIEVINV